MIRRLTSAFIIALVLLLPVLHSACAQTRGVSVTDLWAYPPVTDKTMLRAYGPGASSVLDVYGSFLNEGASSEAITGIASHSANLVVWVRGNQLTHSFPIALPPGKPVGFHPESQFLRLYGVSGSHQPGDSFPITIHFARTPPMTIHVVVHPR